MDSKARRTFIAAVMREYARMGGLARRRNLTKAERSAIAKKASQARWRKAKKQKPAA